MSQKRKAQWTQRLQRLKALRSAFSQQERYDRAYKAYTLMQSAYDRWADEIFAAHRTSTRGS